MGLRVVRIVLEGLLEPALGVADVSVGELDLAQGSVSNRAGGLELESVTTGDGGSCTTDRKKDVLSITLDRPREKGEEFELVIRYAGEPTSGLWTTSARPGGTRRRRGCATTSWR